MQVVEGAASISALEDALDEPLHEDLLGKLEPAIIMVRSKEDQSGLAYGLARYRSYISVNAKPRPGERVEPVWFRSLLV